MQNKPNLLDAQMNVNSILTKDYERNDIFAVPENKANSNPIKANTEPIKPKTNPIQTQNKPNQTQFQRRKKMLLRLTINGRRPPRLIFFVPSWRKKRAKKVEYFRIFHTLFRISSNVFECFRIFSNVFERF